jgi:hypothetical protein
VGAGKAKWPARQQTCGMSARDFHAIDLIKSANTSLDPRQHPHNVSLETDTIECRLLAL